MKKLLIILAVVVVLGGGAFLFFKLRNGGPEGVEVEVAPVTTMTVVETVDATGRIQPKTQVNISADVSAKITRLGAEEGQQVEKGTLLVELESQRYVAAVESSEASLRVARSNGDVARENKIKAEKDYGRARDLYSEGMETQAALDSAAAMFEAEKARHAASLDQVARARADLKQLQDDLSRTTIYAPMAGTVSQLNKEEGEIALGSQFQEDVILVLSNLSGMEAEVQVDENDIVSVAIGDIATVEVDALPDVELKGEVTEIANSATIAGSGTADQKTEFRVKIAITDPDSQLRPGMTATADIVTDRRESAVGVPIQAVAVRTAEQLRGDAEDEEVSKWKVDDDGFVEIVFVVDDGKAAAQQVETGIQSETHIEIIEGLNEGDQVVVGNYRAISRDLQDGSEVEMAGASEDDDSGSS